MTEVLLVPRGPVGLVQPEWTIIDLDRETKTAWFGKPLSNARCPVLEYPKFAWKEVERATHTSIRIGPASTVASGDDRRGE